MRIRDFCTSAITPLILTAVIGATAHGQQPAPSPMAHGGMATMNDEWPKAKLDKSPRHREWVTIKHGGRSVQAFVVYPEVKEKAPVIID